MKRVKGHCTLCGKETQVKRLPLYVIGSEGIAVCQCCEMELVDHCRLRMSEMAYRKKHEALKRKRERHE